MMTMNESIQNIEPLPVREPAAVDVVALGELLIDFATLSTGADGYPIMAAHPGGAPANFLAALTKFGAKTAMLGKVGSDTFGTLLMDSLQKAGIETRGMRKTDDVFTTLAFVTFDETGDRRFAFSRKPGADTCITFEEMDLSLIDEARAFHFGTLSLTDEPARSATQKAVAYAKSKGKLITYDPNLRKPLWSSLEEARKQLLWGLMQADVVKISDEEVRFLFDLGAEDGAQYLLDNFPVKLVFVTCGADGCYFSSKKASGRVASLKNIIVKDTTGAGDIFGGSALWKLLQYGQDPGELEEEALRDIVTFACTSAGLSTTKFGGISSVPEYEEVMKEMEGKEVAMPHYSLKKESKELLDRGFAAQFGCSPERYFSAPGRTEIGGNHTDHQHGCVLAGAVDLDTVAAVRENGTRQIRILSQGYPLCEVSLEELSPAESEINTTAALVRGIAARFTELGARVEGFDAYIQSTVLPGSGLSSSAAFEVLLGTVCNALFFGNRLSMPEIAKIGQYAENVYFGKPCGLMDQMASAVGNLVAIDFADPQQPEITPVDFDFSACGYALCIIDSKASHADLTDEYAAVPRDMKAIAGHFGAAALREVAEDAFYGEIPALRAEFGDRAVLRAIHFYGDNRRVGEQVKALQAGDLDTFLGLVRGSGYSSWMYLQNVVPAGAIGHQDMAIALGVCHKLLGDRGAFRVHGGGFAGTIQAFVPVDMLEEFRTGMDGVLGQGACHVLSIRPQGGIELEA